MGWAITIAAPAEATDVVQWNVPAECPDAGWMQAAIERYIGRDLAIAPEQPVSAVGTITRTGDRYTLALTIDAGADASETRALDDRDCRLLAQAAALMIAVALDPDAAVRAMTVEPPPLPEPTVPAPAEPPPTTAEPVASKPATTRVPTTRDATVTPADDREPDREPAGPRCAAARVAGRAALDPRSPCVGLGVRAGIQLGVLPTAIEPGLQGEVSVFWPRFRVELGGSHWFARRARVDDTRGGEIQLSAAHVAGCYRIGAGPVEIPACVGLEIGALRGEGVGITDEQRDALVWGAATLGPRLMWPFVRRAALVAQADLVVPFSVYAFAIDGLGTIHETRPIAGRGTLGIELRLP